MAISTIPEFYRNKHVFITGASGFLGKVLVEKLLRSCPDIGNVYILVRPKKGKSLQERVDQITNYPLFDILKQQNSDAIKKIVPLKGDVTQLDLGLSETDKQLIIDNVSLIFHAAASVRFDDSFKEAVLVNVKSALEISKLALQVKNLLVFQHVSTTYCNIDKKVVEEVLYPSHGDWREALTLAEECDETTLETFTPKYINPFPNTYTYAKLLAEHVINDLLSNKVPTVIYRPSVVISSTTEPFRGWIDNFNGPCGLLVAGGKGILRVVYGDRSINTDYVSVDNTVKLMIVAMWEKFVLQKSNTELSIYNGSKHKLMPVELGKIVDMGKRLYWEVPFESKLWFPRNKMTKCWHEYYIKVLLFHILPAIFVDALLKVIGRKPILFKIQRKIYIANMAVSHFMLNEWEFVNKNALDLNDKIVESDRKDFSILIPPDHDDIYDYFKKSCNFCRWFLIKESRDIKPSTYVNTRRMYILDMSIKIAFLLLLCWWIFKSNLLGSVWNATVSYWQNL